MEYIDSHAHLHAFTTRSLLNINDPIQSWQEVWNNAKQNGVTKILNIFDVSDEHEMKILPDIYKEMFVAAAVHPCNVHKISLREAHDILVRNMNYLHCIGETGLDTYNNINNLQIQIEFLHMHLQIAAQYNKPVSIHCRGDNLINILVPILRQYNITFVMHCCTYTWNEIQQLMNMNCYISISGIVTYKKAIHIKELAQMVPMKYLLIETDSPFLTPEIPGINRSKTNNQSSYIIHIYNYIATIRKTTIDDLKNNVYDNFRRFLNLA